MILSLEDVTKIYKVPKPKKGIHRLQIGNSYNEIRAVDNINLNVDKAEAVGYIGLNGAGKSTTIKLMTGILTPTEGKISMYGEDIRKNKNSKKKRFSVVFGQRSNLWYDLPVLDTYQYIRVLYDVPKQRFKENLSRISEQLEIEELLNRPVRKLSLGQKMKCELGMALLYDPELLFLDEPTIGLDIMAKENFLNCIQQIKEETGITVILTTHNMDEISKFCERIVVLDRGKILFDGSIEQIELMVGNTQKIKISVDDYDKIEGDDKFIKFQTHPVEKGIIELEINRNDVNAADIMKYYFQNCNVKDVNIENSNLEQLVKKLYSKGKEE